MQNAYRGMLPMEQPALNRLIEIVQALRHPKTGCSWDLKQTHSSLLPYLFEESYEFQEAVEMNDDESMIDELGDLLLQVVLHAQLASERKAFTLEQVANHLSEKLIRRHPHVFGDATNSNLSPEQVSEQWQEIKALEAKSSNKPKAAISMKLMHNPALRTAELIGHKTKELNFDWDDPSQVSYKVEEEWQELKEELVPGVAINQERIAEELGDFLFSTAQLSRHLGINPELALRKANLKFLKRFAKVEALIVSENKKFSELSQQDLDVYWNQAKKLDDQ
jgi:MazG family protein